MRIDDNIDLADDGTTTCLHCGATLGSSPGEPTREAIVRERDSRAAGPSVHEDPKLFVDRPIVLRQRFCPGCLVVLATEIVPSDEPSFRGWSMTAGGQA